MAARLEAFIHGGFDVAHIVERVENADDIHSVLHTPAHKAADGIVRIMVVAQQILAAQQHLQLGVFHVGFDFAQPLPRILVQERRQASKVAPAPGFYRIKATSSMA